jgi:hypothetical protein
MSGEGVGYRAAVGPGDGLHVEAAEGLKNFVFD